MAEDRDSDAADREWLGSLFGEFSVALTRFAIRRVGEAAAGDVVSETFLVAWRRRHDMPRDRPGPWLFTTAAFVIQHEIRSNQRRTTLHDRAADAEATQGGDDDHATKIADRLTVHQALSQLPERDQEVLRLIEWDQLSPEDAAAVLDCSISTLKVRLHRARRRFAKRLAAMQSGEVADDEDFRSRLLALSPAIEEGGTAQ